MEAVFGAKRPVCAIVWNIGNTYCHDKGMFIPWWRVVKKFFILVSRSTKWRTHVEDKLGSGFHPVVHRHEGTTLINCGTSCLEEQLENNTRNGQSAPLEVTRPTEGLETVNAMVLGPIHTGPASRIVRNFSLACMLCEPQCIIPAAYACY